MCEAPSICDFSLDIPICSEHTRVSYSSNTRNVEAFKKGLLLHKIWPLFSIYLVDNTGSSFFFKNALTLLVVYINLWRRFGAG